MTEGAIINVDRGRVRFREDPEGVAYELRPESGEALAVFRIDEARETTDSEHFLGRLIHGRQGWRPEMIKRDRLREQLVIIARAWNRALVLHR